MPFQIVMEPDMEEDELRISVVDVYDLASEIGKEFEKIIDRNGADAVTGLMPMVISSLEQLEKLATRHESTTSYIEELRATIVQLENEKIGKAEDRVKYERELEEIEDRLREESHELVAMVSRLQDENRKLSTSLAKSEGTVIHSNGATPEIDLKVVTRLQEIVEAQREQIHKTEKDYHLKSNELDNLKSQLEKINHVNRELRRRQRTNNNQMRSLIDERAELQAALQEETRAVSILRQRLGLAQKENEDLASSSSDSLDLTNKLVFDRDDPNRPRFTMTELKEILYERNELKARVSDLEDELEMYRPKEERQRSHIICPPVEMLEAEGGLQPPTDPLTPPLSLSDSLSNEIQDAAAEDEEEEDPPVQGPMPYEPEDAPWKKGESGIRKFFVFKDFIKGRLKTASWLPVSVDSLVMGRLARKPVPREDCFSLGDPECLPNKYLPMPKCRTNYCNIKDIRNIKDPYGNGDEDLFSFYKKVNARERTFKNPSVFIHNCIEVCSVENCESFCMRNCKCCPLDSPLPNTCSSKHEPVVDVLGVNCLNSIVSGEPSSDYNAQCFENNFDGPVFQSVNVEDNVFLDNDICDQGNPVPHGLETWNSRYLIKGIPKSLSNLQCGLLHKGLLFSLQYFLELDTLGKSSINWKDLSNDEFLIPEFNFYEFYKPLVAFSCMH